MLAVNKVLGMCNLKRTNYCVAAICCVTEHSVCAATKTRFYLFPIFHKEREQQRVNKDEQKEINEKYKYTN